MDAQDNCGRTALFYFVLDSHIKIVDVLMDNGADPDIAADDGLNPLHRCCLNGTEELMDLFLDRGCNVNAVDYIGHTPLMRSTFSGRRTPSLLSKLLAAGADVNQEDFTGQTSLHHAIISISAGCLQRITINESRQNMPAPDEIIIKTLLRNGADPSQRDHYGWSSLDWASQYPSMLALLLPPHTLYHLPDEAEVASIRHHSLKPALTHLVHLNNLKSPVSVYTIRLWYNFVGRLLLASNYREDARTAYTACAMANRKFDKPVYCSRCDICHAGSMGDRHVCETCADVDLCGDCLKLCMMEPVSQPPKVSMMLRSCKGHNFFCISEDEWRKLPEGIVNGRGETRAAFVERLRKTFGIAKHEGLASTTGVTEQCY